MYTLRNCVNLQLVLICISLVFFKCQNSNNGNSSSQSTNTEDLNGNDNTNDTTDPPNMEPPNPPKNFQAITLSTTSISLQWTASSGISDTNSIKYEICYGTTAICSTSFIPTISSIDSTTYILNDLNSDTNYFIYLRAVDSAGNKSSSVSLQNNPVKTNIEIWSGVKLLGTDWDDLAKNVSADSLGNIFITGSSQGNLDGQTNPGSSNYFVVKYDVSGTRSWTNLIGTPSSEASLDIISDANGNIYVTGETNGNLGDEVNSGSRDIFVSKFNPNGLNLWTRLLGSNGDDGGSGIATDSSNYIYITGFTTGDLDNQTFQGGSSDIFLAKYDLNGTRLWTRLLGTNQGESGTRVVVDSSNDIYITGFTTSNLDNQTFQGGNSDIFLAKYDPSGTKLWTRLLGTNQEERARDISTDNSGNIYITGYTYGELDSQSNAGFADIFVAKYNSSGDRLWTRLIGGNNSEQGLGIIIGESGNIYTTGFTESSALEGKTNSGINDIFVMKHNTSGEMQWIKLLGTNNVEVSGGITTTSGDTIFVVGGTQGNLEEQTNMGGLDIFIAKYNSNGILQ